MYPVNLILDDKPCLVIGGGEVAYRKIQGLLAASAKITVIAPELLEKLSAMHEKGLFSWLKKPYKQGDIKGFFLAVCATDDENINKLAAAEARKEHILINVVDRLSLCDFAMPAVIRRGDLLVTSSTNGKSPAMAREIRRELEKFLDTGYAPFIEKMAVLRQEAMQVIPTFRQREEFWRSTLDENILKMVREGKVKEAEGKIRNAISSFGT
ncbi:precorrin-2 dehydrogenase/sirohydrochlorin ferrochelatase family protein [Pectinatus cerevisiiphilus]|uniref:precorrin-2 dehydrogenase n=1 Tax=Pectinatus cerevisiiphilus TaxID=86956 RepID=A0A4R3KFL4_9FIRM|nr:bifunctional precorrin-2 dehydrogenase/sirohydrochlorin ferrochelatase [Pectinatus cerevisiiphilus]TCS81990.1 precorrin-2 dehydrogenase/sirohydrochlorin ferrochelatase [Pectinatus cerevisiiphilus]